MSDEPIQDKYREQMRAIALALDDVLNPGLKGKDRKVGFMLLMFDFGTTPTSDRINYISNSDRIDAINSMKEFIARAEGRISDSESLQ